ncbi:MAG: thioredoxin domain-containing protein [Phycisphaerales bacterium]
MPAHTNRLASEASPYLLQHAHNPVDWFPWGEEAFAEARRRDVPIFLSVGYSTCYWCHVMERESFESDSIAAIMNERFVCVKVDREQRPDVDDIYMAATQIMTGHGGWPMSVFLEPGSLRPFWCGTYFPAGARPGLGSMPTFPQVLDGIARAWGEQRDEVMEQAESLASAVRGHLAGGAEPAPLGIETVQEAVGALLRMFDRTHGGFGGAPKFPQPVYLDLLLDVRDRAGDDATRAAIDEVVRHTLDRMAVGGMRDQAGGGFHRYSVDGHWTVPHFEKMLYDNAMLAEVYARAAAVYGSAFYRDVARTTIGYVLREMTRRDGSGRAIAFHTAQDAEVDHREGLNYLWTPEEVREALGHGASVAPDDADLAIRAYGLDRGPNFRDPHHPEEPAKHVLRMDLVPDEMADRLGVDRGEFAARMERINRALLAARSKRKQPHLDDKAVLSWNALMVRALAVSGMVDPARRDDLATAFVVARSLLGSMRGADGTLMRVARNGVVQTPALLEDYAAMVRALVTLAGASAGPTGGMAAALGSHVDESGAHGSSVARPPGEGSGSGEPGAEAPGNRRAPSGRGAESGDASTGGMAAALGSHVDESAASSPVDPAWAEGEARRLIGQAEALFGDGAGGFFDTREGATDLFVRTRATYDGAMPAGATLMALGLAELAMRTREAVDVDRAIGRGAGDQRERGGERGGVGGRDEGAADDAPRAWVGGGAARVWCIGEHGARERIDGCSRSRGSDPAASYGAPTRISRPSRSTRPTSG